MIARRPRLPARPVRNVRATDGGPTALNDRRVISRLGRRLRIVLVRNDASRGDDGGPAPAEQPRLVEFVAYSEDCLLSGYLSLAGERLTDLMNEHDEYHLVDVLVSSLSDGRAIEVKDVLVPRDELYLVHATGPRGNPARRQRTRQHAMAFQVGPYQVRGYFHALPGTDPILALRRRRSIVPVTDAWIEYTTAGTRQRRRISSLLINRELLDWAVEAADEEVEFPDLPLAVESGPLVKDFTGQIHVEPSDLDLGATA